MHPVGVKAQKQFLCQQIRYMPYVEVREGWFKDRAVQPSATLMSWVNHAHYALSGNTCRESFMRGVYREYWGIIKASVAPPHTLRRECPRPVSSSFGAILSISLWPPRWTHTYASNLKLDNQKVKSDIWHDPHLKAKMSSLYISLFDTFLICISILCFVKMYHILYLL